MTYCILIAEDEASQRFTYADYCRRAGYHVIEAADGQEALSILEKDTGGAIHALLTDLTMPKLSGADLIQTAKQLRPTLPIVVLTMSNNIDDAVACLRSGAYDFLTKPVEYERLRLSLQHALEASALRMDIARLTRAKGNHTDFTDMVGHDSGLKSAVAMAKKLATSDMPVLITGESGSGKEAFAKAIHSASKRAGHPFIAVNCSAIPENLAESVLFGHEKGAFTGAIAKTLGKFREAQGGTIFLDEVGELSPDIQAKLLRVIQNQEIEPVGLGKPVNINVRIISATHRNLKDDVASGAFREDLFYRLSVLPLALPTLRDRPQDIPALVHYFADRLCAREGIAPKIFHADAMALLYQYRWPGNVRELENCISRAMLLAAGNVITYGDIEPLLMPTVPASAPTHTAQHISLVHADGRHKTMAELEIEIIQSAMHTVNQAIPKAARVLDIGQSTLYRKVK